MIERLMVACLAWAFGTSLAGAMVESDTLVRIGVALALLGTILFVIGAAA